MIYETEPLFSLHYVNSHCKWSRLIQKPVLLPFDQSTNHVCIIQMRLTALIMFRRLLRFLHNGSYTKLLLIASYHSEINR